MANKDQYKAKDFIDAIKGSDGIITTIARRMNCDWNTARKYIETYSTVKAAYEAEREGLLDAAESILSNSIKAATQVQNEALQNRDFEKASNINTADVKWVLARRGKHRGYAERLELDVVGLLGKKLEDMSDEDLDDIANRLE